MCTLFIFSSELREELRPDKLPDVSEVSTFDATKLKHVETKESNVLPTKDGNEHQKSPYNINTKHCRQVMRRNNFIIFEMFFNCFKTYEQNSKLNTTYKAHGVKIQDGDRSGK